MIEDPHGHAPKNLRELWDLALKPLREFMDEPLPRGVGIFHTTGSMCLAAAALQAVTGVLMALYYTPSPDVAWESVRFVDEKVPFGRIIHGLHHWGSSAFVVMVFIHMVRVFAFASYKGKRAVTWLAGVGILGVVLGFGFTGYLLPWDLKAYFGTQVGTNIAGYAPLAGPHVRRFLLGGEEISELTLPRFYAIHVLILPSALAALVAAHLYLVRLFGITPPFKRDGEPVEYPSRFFPKQALLDSTMILILYGIVMALAVKYGGNLGEKADPNNTTYAPHPEWYFLGLQQLLRYFTGKLQILGTFVIPAGFMALLALLPFIDRNPERRPSKRPVALTLLVLTLTAIVLLTFEGARQLELERAEKAKESAEAAGHESAEASDSAAPAESRAAAPEAPAAALAASGAFTPEEESRGKVLYEKLDCAACHAGPRAGKDENLPPSLDYAGNRFTGEWMMVYLKEIPRRRLAGKGRHPDERMPDYRFSPEELRAVSAHLLTMRKDDLFPKEPGPSTPESIAKGKELYETDSCKVCHSLEGKGGKTAPDLTGMGSRLHPAFVFGIIKHPQTLIPGTTMEDTLMEDAEVEAMTHYLMSLK